MSQGPGKIQRAVLDAVRKANGSELTFESMRWSLYETTEGAAPPHGAKLPTKWNTSFRRAVLSMADRCSISIDERPFQSFEECCEHYPGKTLNFGLRDLRRRLLPALKEWMNERYGLFPRYGAAENEQHHLNNLRPEFRDQLHSKWLRLEKRLRPIYGNANNRSETLLRLLTKGCDLFIDRNPAPGRAFAHLVREACRIESLPADLAFDLRAFANEFMPTAQGDNLKFKSIIHELVKVPSHGKCHLRDDTLRQLHKRRKDEVEMMLGFKESKVQRWMGKTEYDSRLHKLFDHTVFQKFRFISVA